MKLSSLWIPCLLLVTPLQVPASSFTLAVDKSTDKPGVPYSQFSVQENTQIPGVTLKPGSYNIRIVDHLSDRMVLRVERDGKAQATFLALPGNGPNSSGPIRFGAGAGAKSALKGFAFTNGTVAEFVYPKDEAVGLAKKNGTRIPAIDPTSEGRTANHGNLSPEDFQLVTLWLLSPTTVGPEAKGGILAERYHATQAATQDAASSASSAPTETASAQVPPRPVHRAKPIMAALPHTAGSMPLVWLTGLFALCGAALLTGLRRLRTNG